MQSPVYVVAVSVVLACGLLLRVLMLVAWPPIEQDQALHVTVARHVLEGRWQYFNSNGFNFYSLQESGLSPYNHPLYHLVTAGVAAFHGDVEQAARQVSFVASLGLMLLLFAAASLLLPPGWALLVLAMVAFNPRLAYLSVTAYVESLYLFLLSAGLLCLTVLWRGGRVWAPVVGAGVAVGLAALTKPEATLLAPLYAVFAAVGAARAASARPREPWLRAAAALLVVLAVGQSALVPYRLYFRLETGRWKPVSKSLYTLIVADRLRSVSRREAFFGLNEARTDTVLADRLGRETLSGVLARNWPWLVPTMARNALAVLRRVVPPYKDWAGPAVLLLGVVAALHGWRRRRPDAWLVPAVAVHGAVQVAAYSVLVPGSRALVTLVPALALFVAASLRQFVTRHRAEVRAVAVCFVLVVGSSMLVVPKYVEALRESVHIPVVGRWLRDNAPPDAIIMCHNPGVAYYAGRRHCIMPVAPAAALRAYAVHRGAAYVVVDLIKDDEDPDLLEMAPGFALETEMDFGRGVVRIYRIVRES